MHYNKHCDTIAHKPDFNGLSGSSNTSLKIVTNAASDIYTPTD